MERVDGKLVQLLFFCAGKFSYNDVYWQPTIDTACSFYLFCPVKSFHGIVNGKR